MPQVVRTRWTSVLAVLALVVGLTAVAVPSASAAGAVRTRLVTASADTWVSAEQPTRGQGSSTDLWADGSPTLQTVLRFDVPAGGALLRGRLHLFVTRSSEAFEVRRLQDAPWDEATLTSATLPAAAGEPAVRSGPVAPGRWATVDVTSLLPSAGTVSLLVSAVSSTAQAFSSREAGAARAPRLALVQSPPAADTAPPTVQLTSPAPGTTLDASQVVDVRARVTDDVGVTRVEFYDNGVLRGTEDTAPFSWTWTVSSAVPGPHRWTARAYDGAGRSTTSAPVDVTVVAGLAAPVPSPGGAVAATAETAPVPSAGDAADDAAVWLHPTDPSRSTVIGTDKLGGLAVYDLSGRQLAYYADSTPNNVDVRYGFSLAGKPEALVVTSDRATDALRVYRVDPVTRGLVHVSARTLSVGLGISGLCTYRSAVSGRYYAFDTDSSGTVQQWELVESAGRVDARKVRQFALGSTVEGCVADDETGALYLAEEDVAIWRYDAEPGGGTTRTRVDAVGAGRLVADVEGLALYQGTGGSGYLVASSQGSSSYAVYDRRSPNAPVKTFGIGAGAVDAVTYTDGLDVLSTPLGSAFPEGLLVVQDDRDDSGGQNFKLVPWGAVARSGSTPLTVDTSWAPHGSRTTTAPPAGTTGTAYYVDALAGDDSRDGRSPQTAWRSLAKAGAVVLGPGEQLLLARGSVWRGGLVLRGGGSPAAPAVLGAYGTGPAPVLRDATTCLSVPGSSVVVRDLEVRSCTWAGIQVAGSGTTVERNLVTDTAAGVYVKAGATDNRVLHNRLVDNARMSVLTDTSANDDSGAFGVLLRGDRTEVAWNTISGSDAFSYDYGRDGAAVEVYGGVGNHVHHNRAFDNDAFTELGSSRSADNVFAYNEVRSSLPTSVFVVTRGAGSSYGPVLGTRLLHNTVLLTGASSQGVVCHAGCSSAVLTMRSNVVQAVAKVGYADAPFDEGHGVYSGGRVQFAMSPTSVVAPPGFVDPAGGDLRLRATSPAVDRGPATTYTRDLDDRAVPVDGDGDGTARPDAGAYERRP